MLIKDSWCQCQDEVLSSFRLQLLTTFIHSLFPHIIGKSQQYVACSDCLFCNAETLSLNQKPCAVASPVFKDC